MGGSGGNGAIDDSREMARLIDTLQYSCEMVEIILQLINIMFKLDCHFKFKLQATTAASFNFPMQAQVLASCPEYGLVQRVVLAPRLKAHVPLLVA